MSCDRWIAILRTNRSDGPHNTECCTIAFSFLCFKQRQRRRTLHSKILRKRIDIINFYQFFSLYKTKLIVCLTNTKEETKSFTHHTCTRSTKRIKGRDESVIYLKWCRRRRRIHQKPMTKPKNLPLHRNYSLSNFSTWILRKGSLSATVVRLLSKVLIAYWGSKSERKKSKQSKALNTTNDNQHRQMFLGEYTWSSNQKCDWLISHRTTPYSLWLRQMLQRFFFFKFSLQTRSCPDCAPIHDLDTLTEYDSSIFFGRAPLEKTCRMATTRVEIKENKNHHLQSNS